MFKRNSGKTDYAIYVIGQGVGVVSGLILLPLFTKKLPTVDFGIIGLLWLITPITSRLINLGLDVAITLKFFKLSQRELSTYLYNALFTITVMGLLLAGLGLWQIHWVQNLIDSSVTRPVYGLLLISIVGSTYSSMMSSFLIKMSRAVQNVLVAVLPPIAVAIATYILITRVYASYTSYVAGMAIGNGVFGLVALLFFFVNYSVKHFRLSINIQKELFWIGLPTIPGTLGAILLASGDRYVIKWFLGLEAVAVYTLGYRFAEYISRGLLVPLEKVLNPVLFKKAASNFEEASAYNYKVSLFLFSGLSLGVAAIVIPMKDILDWFGDTGYAQSYTIFLIALPGILIFTVVQLSSFLLLHLERTDLTMWRTMVGAIINIGLNIWLIPLFGIVAAALTTILSYFVMLVLTITFVNRFTVNRRSIISILMRLVPLIAYLIGTFVIDEVIQTVWWQAYLLKFGLWVGLALMTWLLFSEFRDMFYSLIPTRFSLKWQS